MGASTMSNSPESEKLTTDQEELFEAARVSAGALRKTFENHWVAIGKAVVEARRIAKQIGGRDTFKLLIEQQGLSEIVDKSTASRLLKIMDELPKILEWRESLPHEEKLAWTSPSAIVKHYPSFLPRNKVKRICQQFEPTAKADVIAGVLVNALTPSKASAVARQILELLKKKP
jgi:hypothetical protein